MRAQPFKIIARAYGNQAVYSRSKKRTSGRRPPRRKGLYKAPLRQIVRRQRVVRGPPLSKTRASPPNKNNLKLPKHPTIQPTTHPQSFIERRKCLCNQLATILPTLRGDILHNTTKIINTTHERTAGYDTPDIIRGIGADDKGCQRGERGRMVGGAQRVLEHSFPTECARSKGAEAPNSVGNSHRKGVLDTYIYRVLGYPWSGVNWPIRREDRASIACLSRFRHREPETRLARHGTNSTRRLAKLHVHYMHPMRAGTILHGPTFLHHTNYYVTTN